MADTDKNGVAENATIRNYRMVDDPAQLAAFDQFMRTEAPPDYDASNGDAWYIWKTCWRAALASRPAEVDDEGLPALPEATMLGTSRHGSIFRGYTSEQFRQGQRDAVAADRARMPDADEISDAITEAYNMACVHKDWEAKKYWRELGDKFSAWSAPSHTTNKEK